MISDTGQGFGGQVRSCACAFCEHFDGGGLAKVERARAGGEPIAGDCHNTRSPRFTTNSNDTCGQFQEST